MKTINRFGTRKVKKNHCPYYTQMMCFYCRNLFEFKWCAWVKARRHNSLKCANGVPMMYVSEALKSDDELRWAVDYYCIYYIRYSKPGRLFLNILSCKTNHDSIYQWGEESWYSSQQQLLCGWILTHCVRSRTILFCFRKNSFVAIAIQSISITMSHARRADYFFVSLSRIFAITSSFLLNYHYYSRFFAVDDDPVREIKVDNRWRTKWRRRRDNEPIGTWSTWQDEPIFQHKSHLNVLMRPWA